MRICILGNYDDVPVRNLIQFLVADGHEIHLLSFGRPTAPAPVHAQSLGSRRRWGLMSAWSRLPQMVSRIRPDVVHATYLTSYGYLASTVADLVPVLQSGRGSDVFGSPQHASILRPVRRHFVHRSLRRAHRIHSVADHMTARMTELGADPGRISTFPWGISLDQFAMRRDGIPSPPFRLVCNRHLELVYDHHTLLLGAAQLVQRHIPFTLRIVGDGSLQPALVQQSRNLGLAEHVQFIGRVGHEAMPDLLGDADIFISASTSDGTPSSLLESMAAGCIPVATDIAAYRRWVRDGNNGFLFAPGDPIALSNAVIRALAGIQHWPEIWKFNRSTIAGHGSQASGSRKLVQIYDEMRM